mgnify:CR=1 FL=1
MSARRQLRRRVGGSPLCQLAGSFDAANASAFWSTSGSAAASASPSAATTPARGDATPSNLPNSAAAPKPAAAQRPSHHDEDLSELWSPDESHEGESLEDLLVARGIAVPEQIVASLRIQKQAPGRHYIEILREQGIEPVHFLVGRKVVNFYKFRERYIEGEVAQTAYVGAQIMCWTFIIQYAENELGIDKATAQNHNILAMVIFLCSRFICTFFLKYVSPGRLLFVLSVAGIACTLGAIHLQGMQGLYSLVAISACMSLMFPTIYGLALDGVGEDAKLGSAGLIFAIVGGAFMPRLQGQILDMDGFMGASATRGSFYLPAICFVVIAGYGILCWNRRQAVD